MSAPKIGISRRKAVDLASFSPVNGHLYTSEKSLPWVVEPFETGTVALPDWAAENRPKIEENLYKHGAVLFRNFGLKSVADFEHAAGSIAHELYGGYGDLPRVGASDNIYKSTPYPPDKAILFHNESSHLNRWPMKIAFFCIQAAAEGGNTPIIDCRQICREMRPELLERFATKGLMYVRNFGEGLDVSWRDFFHTSDKAEVERMCAADRLECEWKSNGGLRIRHRTMAVTRHPRTGEQVFFNQIQLHHLACLDLDVRKSLRSIFAEEDLPRNVYFGDGSIIEDEVLDEVGDLFWRISAEFPWQAGDMIVLDNMLVSHARKPYVGERSIAVAMGDMVDSSAFV
jgi:hypothetical protein